MLQFQSHVVVAAASNGFEALASLSHEDHHLGSIGMISTPYHEPPWMNPTSSSSSSLEPVLFDDGPLDLSEIDTFVNQMGCLESWGSLEKSQEEIARPLKASDAASDPQLNVLNESVKKCNATEDLMYVDVSPQCSFLQDVTRPLNNAPGYNMGHVIQQDSFGSVVHSKPREAPKNDSKDGVLKLPAKRLIGAKSAQLRPNKRGALHHKSGEMEISQREMHIQSERERRKGMNDLFERMRALLPSPTQKADKSTVVSEIINYIQSLQQNLEGLNKKRAKAVSTPGGGTAHIKSEPLNCAESIQSRCTDSNSPPSLSPNEESTKEAPQVALHFNGNDIFITICCSQKANLLPAIIYVVENHNLQIMCANVSRTDTLAFHCLHVKALDTLDINSKQALRDALKKLVSSDNQIHMER